MKTRFLTLSICTVLFLSACSDKDNADPIIEKIDVGTIIHSGTMDPQLTTGKIGDFYINLKTQLS